MQRRLGDPSDPTLPVETLRDWYVTVCGGTSCDLGLHQIGINGEALRRNTSLDPATACVRVTVLGRVRRPVLMDRLFEVVPLDECHPDALRRSPGGEAVFPEGDDVLRGRASPELGQPVILNGVARRLENLPDPEEFARVLADILRRGAEGARGS